MVPTKLTKVTTDNEERVAAAVARIPAGRMGTPQDMAGAALFLASPLADYIVGQTIRVGGDTGGDTGANAHRHHAQRTCKASGRILEQKTVGGRVAGWGSHF